MDDRQPDHLAYLVREAEYVRKAYDERVAQTRALERYALLATGLIWSWCATNYALPPVRILIWMPALITFLFGIRAWGYAKSMYTTRDYLVTLERMIALPDDVGWGRHLETREEPRLALTAYLFWAVLQLMTVFIPIFMLFGEF